MNFSLNALKSPWALVIAIPLIVAAISGPSQGVDVSKDALASFWGTLPFILFAVVLVAYLKAAGAEALIANAFKGNQSRTIVLAAVFGGLAPFCSCEVIPFISAMLALGAPLAAVMAFWLSSPLIDPPTLLITAGELGWPFAIAKAVSAVGLGLMGGYFVLLITKIGFWGTVLKPTPMTGCGCGPDPLSQRPMWVFWQDAPRRDVFQTEFLENLLFLSKWLILAYVLEAVMIRNIPADMIVRVVGGEGLMPIVVAAVVGMPAYLNSYVAAPLLSGLVAQGMSQGAALSFMIAGSVSCIPAMAAVWSLVRPKVFAAYVGLGLTGAVISGFIFEMLV